MKIEKTVSKEFVEKEYRKKTKEAKKAVRLAEKLIEKVGDVLGEEWEIGVQLAWDRPAVQLVCHQEIDRIEFKKALLTVSSALEVKLKPDLAHSSEKSSFWIANAEVQGIKIDMRGCWVVGCVLKKEMKEVYTSDCFETFATVEAE